jgi:hypothetical protein
VVLEPLPRNQPLPLGYAVEVLRVDWTHPLLATRLIDATAGSEDLPPNLERLEQTESMPTLRLQLSEPVQQNDEGPWSPALPILTARTGESPTAWDAERSGLALSSLGGWLPIGKAVADEPEWQSPPSIFGDRVAVRWLGRIGRIDTMPSVEFDDFCLLSLTRPTDGDSRFLLIQRTYPNQGRLGELRRWLAEFARDGDWLAIHSIGRQAWVGMKGWRMAATSDARRAQRAGGVLELRARRKDDPVDWVRLHGVRVKASSFDRGFPPLNTIGGRLWPQPLNPQIWMNRLGGEKNEPPSIELEFTRHRPIERIVVGWAGLAGWSPQFHPGRCLLQVEGAIDTQPQTVLEIASPDDPVTVWRPERLQQVHRIQLTFPEPSRDPQDGRARLALIQAWGPWDGETLLRQNGSAR